MPRSLCRIRCKLACDCLHVESCQFSPHNTYRGNISNWSDWTSNSCSWAFKLFYWIHSLYGKALKINMNFMYPLRLNKTEFLTTNPNEKNVSLNRDHTTPNLRCLFRPYPKRQIFRFAFDTGAWVIYKIYTHTSLHCTVGKVTELESSLELILACDVIYLFGIEPSAYHMGSYSLILRGHFRIIKLSPFKRPKPNLFMPLLQNIKEDSNANSD